MSGSFSDNDGDDSFARIGQSNVGSELLDLLLANDIVPGSPPSYQLCKSIANFHPIGNKLAEAPIAMAQSQKREITVSSGPESRLLPAFDKEWRKIGTVGADTLILNTMKTSRIYGISCIVIGDKKHPGQTDKPLELDKIADMDPYFNVLDPLNTAGSLTLNQDPNAPDYQKPLLVQVAGKAYHPSRIVVMMNEQPVYIEWTTSAYGYVGRSVYQRGLFPLKSFVQSMITDDMVTKKIGLLVWKAEAPGSIASNRMLNFFAQKRRTLKSGVTGNVLSIGKDDSVESLNFNNLEGAGRFTRENILKNIATSANMPARMLDQETLASGLAEGSEDAKEIARYIDRVRMEMNPLYSFFDQIVMRRAWTPEFYEGIQADYKEYKKVPFDTAFYQWQNDFQAVWPNLLVEPDSEKMKAEEIRFKSAVAVVESLVPVLDPVNKAAVVAWLADEINSREDLFTSKLMIDQEALEEYEPPETMMAQAAQQEPKPKSFGSDT